MSKNNFQQNRKANIDRVKQTIAKTMPDGSLDKELRAILQIDFGFSESAIQSYLKALEDAGKIEFSECNGGERRWQILR